MVVFTTSQTQKPFYETQLHTKSNGNNLSSWVLGDVYKPTVPQSNAPTSLKANGYRNNPYAYSPVGVSFTATTNHPTVSESFLKNVKQFQSRYLDPNESSIADMMAKKSSFQSTGISFQVDKMTGTQMLSIASKNPIHSAKCFHSMVQIKVVEKVPDTIQTTKFSSWLKDGKLYDELSLGKMSISLEVYRLSEYKFKFPEHYLQGLKPNHIATADGDVLCVYTYHIGEQVLYTDYGTITIRTLPGLRTRKPDLSRLGT